jgi:protein-tyrosine phosphatase
LIDLHSHVLPGLDDGAVDLEASLAMLRAMVDDGIRTVVATPHVREDYPTTPEERDEALERVRAAAAAEGLPIGILPGGEVAIDALALLDPDQRAAFGLGGRPRLLLVETPYHGWSSALTESVVELARSGTTPILAHPERNPVVQQRPELLVPLTREGTLIQLTAASVDGRLGSRPAAASRALLREGLAHLVAGDSHDAGSVGLSGVGRALRDEGLGRWLTEEMPAALLDGGMLPAPVARARRTPLVRRLLRR